MEIPGGQRKALIDIEEMERDHDALHDMIETLQRTLDSEKADERVEEIVAALMAHLDAHISFEERVMAANNYPLASAHIEVHASFKDQFKSILDSLGGNTISRKNVSRLLRQIHEHHILYFDEIMFSYLAGQYTMMEAEEGMGI